MKKNEQGTLSKIFDQFDHLHEILQAEDISQTDWQCAMLCPFDHFLSENENVKYIENISKENQKLYKNRVDILVSKILSEFKYYVVNYDDEGVDFLFHQEGCVRESRGRFCCNKLGDSDFSIIIPEIPVVYCGGFDFCTYLYFKGEVLPNKISNFIEELGLFALDNSSGEMYVSDQRR